MMPVVSLYQHKGHSTHHLRQQLFLYKVSVYKWLIGMTTDHDIGVTNNVTGSCIHLLDSHRWVLHAPSNLSLVES